MDDKATGIDISVVVDHTSLIGDHLQYSVVCLRRLTLGGRLELEKLGSGLTDGLREPTGQILIDGCENLAHRKRIFALFQIRGTQGGTPSCVSRNLLSCTLLKYADPFATLCPLSALPNARHKTRIVQSLLRGTARVLSKREQLSAIYPSATLLRLRSAQPNRRLSLNHLAPYG